MISSNAFRLSTRLLGIAVLAALTVVVFGKAIAPESKQIYQPPSLDGFILLQEEDGDGDGDGVKETHIVRYRDMAGNAVFSMTTKGRLWAWSREDHAGGTDLGRNYVIRDSNCDGKFDERYGLDEGFHVPDCLKSP